MIPSKFSGLSILLILALLISSFAVVMPAAPVKAACTANPTITAPTSVAKAYVAAGGQVTITGTMTGGASSTTDMYIQITNGTTNVFGPMAFEITFSGGGSYAISKTVTISGSAPAGTYNVIVSADGFSTTNSSSVVVDNTAPTVSIIQPNATSGWNPTNANTLSYSTSENTSCTATLSVNGGSSYTYTLFTNRVTNGADSYTVAGGTIAENSANCLIKIVATDNAGNVTTQLSSPFACTNAAPICTVTSPGSVTSESYNQAVSTTVTGTLTSLAGGSYAFYEIGLFSGDVGYGADQYLELISGWTQITLSGSTASISKAWTISKNYRGSNMKIGIRGKDIVGNVGAWAFSTYVFRLKDITVPVVSISYPKASGIYYQGASENVTWSMTDNDANCSPTYYVWLSTDGGTTYSYLIGSGSHEQGTNAINPWVIPGVASTNCKIKVIVNDCEDPANSATALSGVFTIKTGVTPTVTISVPAGGESVTVGNAFALGWTSADTSNTSQYLEVKVEFSANNGSDWVTILNGASYAQGAKTYSWSVANPHDLNGAWTNCSSSSVSAANCRIKVTVTNPASSMVSAEVISNKFTIVGTDDVVRTDSITLTTGWNLVSLTLVPTNNNLTNVLSDIMSHVDAVWTYAGGTSSTTGWTYYKPDVTSTLSTMVDGKAYWIKVDAPCTFTFQGRYGSVPPASPPTYNTVVGWNMVGFKCTGATNNYDATEYLGDQMSGTTRIYNLPLTTYAAGAWASVADGVNLTPGQGYWVYYNVASTISPPSD
jgi:hypothetical protein